MTRCCHYWRNHWPYDGHCWNHTSVVIECAIGIRDRVPQMKRLGDSAMEAYSESLRVTTAWYEREHVFLSEVLNEIGVTRFKNEEFMITKQSSTEVS